MAEDSKRGCCLLSVKDTSVLLSPISSATRIKYTCIAASPHYIALGANTGGVYCFHRNGYQYIRILANQEGSVSLLSFSPSENSLAVCSGGGHVSFWELNLTGGGISKRVHVCTLLKDANVMDMVWDSKSSRLFFGDDQGRLAVSYMPKKVFKKPDEIIYQEKSIVQMDLYQDLLLVSTIIRCFIFNVTSREVVQIGQRQRDGAFGTCFNLRWANAPPIVYSSRPGGRLWEADIQGTVVSTLRLKELISTPATPLLGYGYDVTTPSPSPSSPLHFSSLAILSQDHLVCWGSGILYLFYPASYQLAGWTEALDSLDKLYCHGNQLLVLKHGGRGIRVLEFADVSKSVQALVQLKLFEQCCQVIENHLDEVLGLLPHDQFLLKACNTALTGRKGPLNHQLTIIKEIVDKLWQNVTEVDEDIVCDENGVEGENGVGGEDGEEDVDTELGVDLAASIEVNLSPPPSALNTVNSDVMEVTQSHEDNPTTSSVSQDFLLTNSHSTDEPDLDATLISDESALTSTSQTNLLEDADSSRVDNLASDNPALFNDSTSEIMPVSAVVRLQSKVIPELMENPLQTLDSSNSLGSSMEGNGEINQGASSFEGQFNLESSSVEVDQRLRAHRLSWQASELKNDDVVAIPVIVRSTNNGSLSGKSKSKKKSRRKKIAATQSLPPLQDYTDIILSPSSSLLHAPEEDLPFPEAGLPKSQYSTPSTSHTPSPFPSLPSTPPQSQILPTLNHSALTVQVESLARHAQEITNSAQMEPTQRHSSVKEGNELTEKGKVHRSSSIDVAGIGGVAGALSKVRSMALQGGQSMGQKMVKGFLSSLSTSQLSSSYDGHVNSQAVLYRNNNVLSSPTSPSAIEEGEFALSPSSFSPPMSPPHSNHSSGDFMSQPPPSNPVDQQTLELSNITVATREKLTDPLVLCSPDQLCSVLQSWLNALELYHHSQMDGDVSMLAPPLLSLPPTVMNSVSFLATLCAELAVYSGNSSTPESCDQVTTLEKFIVRYAKILDVAKIRHLLTLQRWEVREKGWWALIRGNFLSDSLTSDLLDRRSAGSLSDQDIITLLLHSSTTPEEFLSLSISSFPRLMPWEVALICNHFNQSNHSSDTGSHDLSYVAYLSRLLGGHGSDIHQAIVNEIFTSDPDLLLLSLQAVLEKGKGKGHTLTAEGNPSLRPWSHLLAECIESSCLEYLVTMCVVMNNEHIQSALKLCQNAGYWLGVIHLFVAIGDRKSALKTILALGDTKLLTQPQPWGSLLGELTDWQLVIGELTTSTPAKPTHSVEDQLRGNTLTDYAQATPTLVERDVLSPTVEDKMVELRLSNLNSSDREDVWRSLLYYMMSTLPPKAINKFLSGCSGNLLLEGKTLHSLLVTATSLHIQQRAVAHTLLEKVDRYLWSPRSSAVGPHISSTLSHEKEADTSGEAAPPSLQLSSSSPLPLLPTLEEVGIHWGVKTSGTTCMCLICRLPLVSAVSEKLPGIVAFSCGHVFHKSCLPEVACIICFTKNILNFAGHFPNPSHPIQN